MLPEGLEQLLKSDASRIDPHRYFEMKAGVYLLTNIISLDNIKQNEEHEE